MVSESGCFSHDTFNYESVWPTASNKLQLKPENSANEEAEERQQMRQEWEGEKHFIDIPLADFSKLMFILLVLGLFPVA